MRISEKKILLNYDKEIPYSVEVVTEMFKEKSIIFIDSIIYVERDTQKEFHRSQKAKLSKSGNRNRIDLEKFFSENSP